MHLNVVYFAHGKESGPWGTKILSLAEVAKKKGFHVESPDYSELTNPDERAQKLLNLKPAAQKNLVLVGSSMGGYISAVASEVLKPAGLFLLAPAVFRAGYLIQDPTPQARITVVVHGWEDEVIPVDDAIRYAKKHHARLHLLNSDHRLTNAIPILEDLFSAFLDEILQGTYDAVA